jgi:hypothetical protein
MSHRSRADDGSGLARGSSGLDESPLQGLGGMLESRVGDLEVLPIVSMPAVVARGEKFWSASPCPRVGDPIALGGILAVAGLRVGRSAGKLRWQLLWLRLWVVHGVIGAGWSCPSCGLTGRRRRPRSRCHNCRCVTCCIVRQHTEHPQCQDGDDGAPQHRRYCSCLVRI